MLHSYLIGACLFVATYGSFAHAMQQERSTSFDYYLIVLQWNPQLSSSFTIHGLWPGNRDRSYPQFCSSHAFSVNEISNLVPTLNGVWLSTTGDNIAFWQHEWEKHGTCSNLDMQSYFSRSINLQTQYNIGNILINSGVVPGRSSRYTKPTVTQAIKSSLGKVPVIRCVNSALAEVGLCVDKSTFGLINCPSTLGTYFACPTQFTYV